MTTGSCGTGCTYLDGSRRYMYYAANHPTDTICDASIGLAVSDDGEHYERHPESPVITCDPRYYVTPDKPLKVFGHGHGHVDCRDLCVVKDPDGRGYWGYFAARIDARRMCPHFGHCACSFRRFGSLGTASSLFYAQSVRLCRGSRCFLS